MNNDKIEQQDTPMTRIHWKRQKKPTVDLQDQPFATDRQLEDQACLMLQNRNPRSFEPTKVDKVRSQIINAKKGATRPVAMKAKVLNKIVREASGVYNYALIPPPPLLRSLSKADELKHDPDPETNPLVRAYAKEAMCKPIMCSFGHRPRSASRVFNPSTMKFRLRHNEIISAGNSTKTGCGLPVAVLQKLLHAPKINYPGHVDLDEEDFDLNNQSITMKSDFQTTDPFNLFSMESSDIDIDGEVGDADITDSFHNTGGGINTKDSWISSNAGAAASSTPTFTLPKRKPNKFKKLAPITSSTVSIPMPAPVAIEDRPSWDEGFHRSNSDKIELFKLRANKNFEILPLEQRLKRFAIKSGQAEEPIPFCMEKQINDRLALRGTLPSPSKLSSHNNPIKGQKLYYDPLNTQLQMIKDNRHRHDLLQDKMWKAKQYQEDLNTIPSIDYHPTTELAKMMKSLPSKPRKTNPSNDLIAYAEEEEEGNDMFDDLEANTKAAMKSAKEGDINSLYDYFMKAEINVPAAMADKYQHSSALMKGAGNASRVSSVPLSSLKTTASSKSITFAKSSSSQEYFDVSKEYNMEGTEVPTYGGGKEEEGERDEEEYEMEYDPLSSRGNEHRDEDNDEENYYNELSRHHAEDEEEEEEEEGNGGHERFGDYGAGAGFVGYEEDDIENRVGEIMDYED